jgi:photosystem II stability/assembly factor-like uncharacterized protein
VNTIKFILFSTIVGCFLLNSVDAQKTDFRNQTSDQNHIDESLFSSLEWRLIGPFRGGRSAAVTGVPGKTNLYYSGATGGGVWKTKDGGQTWKNISDGFFGGSIGSVTVAASDHNVIYAGGGEVTVRGNVSSGDGIWKSEDAGKTWKHIGLGESRHVPRIRVHPQNPDLVYAAVLGDLYKPSDERGVFRSKDGGNTWENILYANADAGAVDLILDPNNPRILYASTWRIRRTPYSLESGGDGSGLWKSTDGGDTWQNLFENKGLPKEPIGIIGIAVSPVNSERVWAIIEANEGGVYRSEDGGESWKKLNDERSLRQRAWYYSRIYADSQDEDVVYVMNVRYHKSTDGGQTFKAFNAPHGDHHDLWIAPEDNQRMIIADDGGAQVSFDGGENWSTYHNQPTAQFYRVTTDNYFPYRIYAAQQDNSTVRIAHRTDGNSISERDWEPSAGGESAHLAADPLDNEIVYGGSYGGYLTRLNHRTKQRQAINVWPDNPMGHGAEGMKYRFQWNFPIFFSPHNPAKIYATSNHVHVSYDQGNSWEIISPDLTRNDSSKLVSSGGPITKDNTGVEYYCTIFAGVESPYEKDLIWVGSDDGLIHISRDNGTNWEHVTPRDLPEWMMINSIDPNPFVPGGAYVAGTRYKMGDYQPYLYKTEDYGKSWKKIDNGIQKEHFTRVVRADPKRKGLLYAGTENGMYISFDDGDHWQSMQLNLPTVPITDLAVKNDNLVVATQGRSIWIIDDLTVLQQVGKDLVNKDFHLYKPMDSYRMGGRQVKDLLTEGTNHPGGVNVHFYLKNENKDTPVSISFYEVAGDSICTYSTTAHEKKYKIETLKTGGNTFRWDMRYQDAKDFEGRIFWSGSLNGPIAIPGTYRVRLTVGDEMEEQEFQILKDPRSESMQEDFIAQFNFINAINNKVTEAHETIIEIRDIRKQLENYQDRIPEDKEIISLAEQIDSIMTEIEESLYQTKNRSRQDPLNYPIKLTNKLGHLNALSGSGNYAPTKQAIQVKDEMIGKVDQELRKYESVKQELLPQFNKLVRQQEIDAIMLKKKGKTIN